MIASSFCLDSVPKKSAGRGTSITAKQADMKRKGLAFRQTEQLEVAGQISREKGVMQKNLQVSALRALFSIGANMQKLTREIEQKKV